MPHKYIYMEPEIAYATKDNDGKETLIYNTYADGDVDFPYTYWFSLDEKSVDDEEGEGFEFDIREFKEYDDSLSIKENFDILIAKGYITSEGWRYNLEDELEKH